jgi:hypothetical protein
MTMLTMVLFATGRIGNRDRGDQADGDCGKNDAGHTLWRAG